MTPSVPRVPPVARDRLIDADQVACRLRMSKRSLYRFVSEGVVPPPVLRRRGMIAKWRESDIDAYLAGLAPQA
jgi:predicted DNA-binding transcriptional regulator AlpA